MNLFAASATPFVNEPPRMHAAVMDQANDSYDVVVIGGGAAGLAGAVALLRSRRSVLLVDAGDPRNAPAGQVRNFLTQDGTAPDLLYAAGRTEVQAYGGQILRADVDTLERDGDLYQIQVQGQKVTARRVLVATGARDELADIAGLAERWGIDVLQHTGPPPAPEQQEQLAALGIPVARPGRTRPPPSRSCWTRP
jgi:flavin-dependent dehydrogenase